MDGKFTSLITSRYLPLVKWLVVTITFGLLILNAFILSHMNDLNKSMSFRQNEAAWFVFQLNKEYSGLLNNVELLMYDRERIDDVRLSYELTWSRFDVLLNSNEAAHFREFDNLLSFFSNAFFRFKLLEPLVEEVADGIMSPKQFYSRIDKEYVIILNEINEKFQLRNPLIQRQQDDINALFAIQRLSSIALGISMTMILWVFWQESIYHRKTANHDPLTGLPNRLAMTSDLESMRLTSTCFTFIWFDLNDFKQINDNHGHAAGDGLLMAVARRLQDKLPNARVTYRIGGDEFAVVLRSVEKPLLDDTLSLLEEVFTQPFHVDDNAFEVSASIGFSQYPLDGDTIDNVIHVADRKMYRQKHKHKTGMRSV
ncbi:GGDEF domain-containing protein [Thaumasiovibrio subtropicus]|uniref:GGDEF domain-containing protein n=1 Tax=Thaumasiovibrio subtropicus TaxID=1891207 RepID=UPI000B35963A|nr:GGDEF domain-containing protein [Thaumasiovibrio subtropicus]